MLRVIHVTFVTALAFCLSSTVFSQNLITNGSFESGLSGWTTVGDVSVVGTPASLFPTRGASYLRVTSMGTGPATPGYGPHTAVSKASKSFTVPSHEFLAIQFDWEWIPSEGLPSFYNDFLSVDVISGGTLVANALFVDTGGLAGTPVYTNVPGAGGGAIAFVPDQSGEGGSGNPGPAGFKRAWLDLSGVAPGTSLSIQISVGNGTDTIGASRAYIDDVRCLVGERNASAASLRVLGSTHQDGVFTSSDQGGDYRVETPFEHYATPGTRIAFRASGLPGAPWALIQGALAVSGTYVPALGTVNLSFAAPINVIIDGIAPGGGDDIIGTLGVFGGSNFLEGFIPTGAAPGSLGAYQALMTDPAAPVGFSLSAATEIVTGPPRMPLGATTGPTSDDGSLTIDLGAAGFSGGSFSLYGMPYTQVFFVSNGRLTFGTAGTSFSETETSFLTGSASIAPIWDDFYPPGGGACNWSATANTVTTSWADVPEYSLSIGGNNFAVQLYNNGQFTLYFSGLTPDDGLCGISPGALPAPGPGIVSSSDWSGSGFFSGSRGTIAAGSARLEQFRFSSVGGLFRDTQDLMTIQRIHFVPDGGGGYTFFTGLR